MDSNERDMAEIREIAGRNKWLRDPIGYEGSRWLDSHGRTIAVRVLHADRCLWETADGNETDDSELGILRLADQAATQRIEDVIAESRAAAVDDLTDRVCRLEEQVERLTTVRSAAKASPPHPLSPLARAARTMAGQVDRWDDLIARHPGHVLLNRMRARQDVGLRVYGVPVGNDPAFDWRGERLDEFLDAAVYSEAGGQTETADRLVEIAEDPEVMLAELFAARDVVRALSAALYEEPDDLVSAVSALEAERDRLRAELAKANDRRVSRLRRGLRFVLSVIGAEP